MRPQEHPTPGCPSWGLASWCEAWLLLLLQLRLPQPQTYNHRQRNDSLAQHHPPLVGEEVGGGHGGGWKAGLGHRAAESGEVNGGTDAMGTVGFGMGR